MCVPCWPLRLDGACEMQGLKKGRRAAMREPAADADTIPAGYITPPKARPGQTEVRTHVKTAALHHMHLAFSAPPMPDMSLKTVSKSYLQACGDTPSFWCRNGKMWMMAQWKAA